MTEEAERGHPTFIALGHIQYNIWSIERYARWSEYPLVHRNADNLISVKVDHWPEMCQSFISSNPYSPISNQRRTTGAESVLFSR